MEQGLHAEVVMIHQKESENKKGKEKTKNYNFQGQSARSRRWFDIYHARLEENLMTREPDFYRNCIKLNLGMIIQKHNKYLECRLGI